MLIARSRVTRQGQISIPAKVRDDLDIRPGTELVWERRENGEYVVRPKRHTLEELHSILADVSIARQTTSAIRQSRREFLERRWDRSQPGRKD